MKVLIHIRILYTKYTRGSIIFAKFEIALNTGVWLSRECLEYISLTLHNNLGQMSWFPLKLLLIPFAIATRGKVVLDVNSDI